MKKIWIVVLALAVFACEKNNDYVTKSGVEVACIVKGSGEACIKDSLILVQAIIQTDSGEVLMETTTERPIVLQYNPEMEAGDIQEVINGMQVGDSVYFETTAYNFFTVTNKVPVADQGLDSATVLKVNLKIADQMSQDGFRAYQMKLREEQMKIDEEKLAAKSVEDIATIDAYLEKNGIEAQTTESGLRYVITEKGNGTYAEAGDNVVVNYAGRILDGPYFDTSVEEIAKANGIYNEQRAQQVGYNPFEVIIGQGRVIKGWDEGIPLISEGGKGTLYIPSALGYGARGAGPTIQPFSILEFQVEVIKVEKQ